MNVPYKTERNRAANGITKGPFKAFELVTAINGHVHFFCYNKKVKCVKT